MLVDKQNGLMSNLSFTVHQHGGDDVTRKPPICRQLNFSFFEVFNMTWGCTGTNHRRTSLWHLSSFFRCGPRYPRSSTHQPEVILVVSLGERVNKNQKLNERTKKFWKCMSTLRSVEVGTIVSVFQDGRTQFSTIVPWWEKWKPRIRFQPRSFIYYAYMLYVLTLKMIICLKL